MSELSRTPVRTFALWPAVVFAEQALARRPVRYRYLPLLAWGYLQYRLAGEYRTRRGGGGPGMRRAPERLVTSGIYAWTRNPMYLGHVVYLTGLALATRSPLAKLVLAGHLPWFAERARADEAGLVELFGDEFLRYRDRVPRWLGVPEAEATTGS
jgi:protein-S-isoprenylcysteine O-methyltransferase Ste14